MTWDEDMKRYQESEADHPMADDGAVANEIRVLQSLQVQRSMPVLLGGNAVAPLLVGFFDWHAWVESKAYLPFIVLYMLLVPMLRSYWRLRNAPRPKTVSRRHLNRIKTHSLLMGLTWAGTLTLLLPHLESLTGLIVILITFFLGYGSVALTPGLPSVAVAYFAPIFLASFAASLTHPTIPNDFAVVCHVIGLVAMTQTARQNWEDVKTNVRVSLERLAAERALHQRETEVAIREKERQVEEARKMREVIADREHAEAEALQKTEILEQTLENMAQGLTMYDEDLVLVTCNQRYKEHFDLVDSVFADSPSFDDVVGTTLRQDYGESWADRLKALRQATRLSNTWRHEFTRPSGRSLDVLGNPMPSGGIVITSTDITDRIAAEHALRISEERYRDLIDGAVMGIAIDLGGVPLFANQAFADIFGFDSADEIVSLNSLDCLYAPEDLEILRHNRIERERGGLAPESYEFRAIRRDGRKIWVEGRFRRITWNNLSAVQSTLIDTTQRKQAEEVLRKGMEDAEALAQAKSGFVALVSHEVRTPLNGVLGMAQLLSKTDLDAGQLQCLSAISSSGKALLRIINDLLDLSKLDAGKLELERVPLHLADLLTESIAIMRPRADGKGITLDVELGSDIPPVLIGDALRIRQVLLNLVGNAVKFTESGSVKVTASVAARRDDDVVMEFVVTDTGRGIAKDAQAKLFTDYTQESMEVARKYGGTGLGLAICRCLVALMGGMIDFKSTQGKGSSFRFTASMRIDRETELAEIRHAAMKSEFDLGRKARSCRPLKILQVEDNAINRELVDKLLTDGGHTVVNAKDGFEALEAVEMTAFDAVVMDRHLPGLDGIDTTTRIRRMPRPLRSIPILGLTAGATQSEIEACRSAGMDIIMTKPLNTDELLANLERLTSSVPFIAGKNFERPVLVVDDQSINRVVAKSQLTQLGIACEQASSGEEALAVTAERGFAAILLDVSMPGMDGLQLTQLLRQREREQEQAKGGPLPRTPIIAMTGHTSTEQRKRFVEIGMDDVLSKPLDFEQLRAVLNRRQSAKDGGDPGPP